MKARQLWAIACGLLAGSALGAPANESLGRGALPPEQAGASELNDDTEQLRDELAALKRESSQRRALTIARGRAYVRLARAGLMPLSGGIEAFSAHTSRLEPYTGLRSTHALTALCSSAMLTSSVALPRHSGSNVASQRGTEQRCH